MKSQMTENEKRRYYEAMEQRDAAFNGLFFVGVQSTGVFCHAVCPARKPKYENCRFFRTAEEALQAGFRPCKRCRPLDLPGAPGQVVRKLLEAVEAEPERRWTEAEIKALGVDTATARRQFQKHFGMSFAVYARARRIGLAKQALAKGERVVEAQLTAGYGSASGFRQQFLKLFGAPPAQMLEQPVLHAAWFDTPLGPVMGLSSGSHLLLLEFADRKNFAPGLARVRKAHGQLVVPKEDEVLRSTRRQLAEYYAGRRKTFDLPLLPTGTTFQHRVWEELQKIPYGEIIAYEELARRCERPSAVRAVGAANGSNMLSVVIPCHRVIGKDGALTGYGGGLPRKRWLLEHEQKYR